MVSFHNPEYLWLLVIAGATIYLYYVLEKRKRSNVIRFSRLKIVRSAFTGRGLRKARVMFALFSLAIILLILALADPHLPLKRTHKGVNVVLVIDVSGSMKATDYKPSRIEAAKQAARTLIKSLDPADNVGIVTFESGATTAAYLSPYKKHVLEKLESVEAKQGATAIGDGLSLGVDMATSMPNRKRLIVLLSDGVNNAGVISPDEAIKFAKSSGVQVFTVGLGSAKPVVLGYDFFGRPQYAQLDEGMLKKIASETGGEYYKSVDSETLSHIYSKISTKIKREKESVSIKDYFIGGALATLLLLFALRYWRYRSF